MTKEDRRASIAALLEERRGYEMRLRAAKEVDSEDPVALGAAEAETKNMQGRIDDIEAQLKALGHGAKKPSDRSAKRPSSKMASKR